MYVARLFWTQEGTEVTYERLLVETEAVVVLLLAFCMMMIAQVIYPNKPL